MIADAPARLCDGKRFVGQPTVPLVGVVLPRIFDCHYFRSADWTCSTGLEVLMNSEVWDLRTLSLLRSVPALDGAAVTFAGPDVLFAIQRPVSDDLRAPLTPPAPHHPAWPRLTVHSAALLGISMPLPHCQGPQ